MEETWIEVGLDAQRIFFLYLDKSLNFSLRSATICEKNEYE